MLLPIARTNDAFGESLMQYNQHFSAWNLSQPGEFCARSNPGYNYEREHTRKTLASIRGDRYFPTIFETQTAVILKMLLLGDVCTYSPVAQLVEQATVNRLVIGSSPIGGA